MSLQSEVHTINHVHKAAGYDKLFPLNPMVLSGIYCWAVVCSKSVCGFSVEKKCLNVPRITVEQIYPNLLKIDKEECASVCLWVDVIIIVIMCPKSSVFLQDVSILTPISSHWYVTATLILNSKPFQLCGNISTQGQLFVCWLLSVPATCECISGMDQLRQFYVLPHWDRSCRSNCLSHPVTEYWHRADQSQCWPYNARRLAG